MPVTSSGEAHNVARDLVSFLKMLRFQWIRTTGVLVLPGSISVLQISHLILTTNSEGAGINLHFTGEKKQASKKLTNLPQVKDLKPEYRFSDSNTNTSSTRNSYL